MTAAIHSRRDFSRILCQSLAAAIAAPNLPNLNPLDAQQTNPMPLGPVRLNFNENPYGPSPKARAALAECGSISNRYPDDAYRLLLNMLAQKYNLKPENIILGCGSTEILRAADDAFLDPTRNVVAAAPTFEAVLDYARVLRSNAVLVPLTSDHRHDLQKMAAACTSKAGVAYVCNPNNPTGTYIPRDDMASFVAAVPPSTLILVDEAYFEFADAPAYGTAIPLIAAHPNVLVARTFSKIYGMAGMRLGYGVGSKPTIELISRYLVQDNINAAVIGAAMATLDDFEGLATTHDKLMHTRDWLYAQLKKDGRTAIPSQGNFVMLDVGTDAKPVIAQFAERQILVGRYFPSMPTFIRVTVGTQPEIEAFVTALRQIVPAPAAQAAHAA